MDGRSLMPLLALSVSLSPSEDAPQDLLGPLQQLPRWPIWLAAETAGMAQPWQRSRAAWRTAYLIEYIATQESVKEDEWGHVTDAGNNTFRGLRVIDSSRDLAYFEFTDVAADWNFTAPQFFELYNVRADPDQLVNIWPEAAAELRAELARRLRHQYGCAGASCE